MTTAMVTVTMVMLLRLRRDIKEWFDEQDAMVAIMMAMFLQSREERGQAPSPNKTHSK